MFLKIKLIIKIVISNSYSNTELSKNNKQPSS